MIHVEQSCDEYEVVAAAHDRARDECYEEHVNCEAAMVSRLDPVEVCDPTGVPVSYKKAADRWVDAVEKAAESVIEQHRKNEMRPFVEDLEEGDSFDHIVEVELANRNGGYVFDVEHTVTFEVVRQNVNG